MDHSFYISKLIQKRLHGELTAAETTELDTWRAADPANQEAFDELTDPKRLAKGLEKLDSYDVQRILAIINSQRRVPVVRLFSWKKIAVAASIILLLGLGWYFLFFEPKNTNPALAKTTDVEAPKTNKARITLADGRMISLDSLTSYTESGMQIIKTADGKIIYRPLVGPAGTDEIYNTLTNPRGSKVIDMQLSDGSHVWLNAGSSITYPVTFIKDRNVTMTGEAYFEVAHHAAMPFMVSKGETSVTVLGTHFNVNAYDDEATIDVTLLEGSVKVNNTVIKPGQQARVSNTINVVNADVEAVMAWKNGYFNFDKTELKTLMRQIARWYDVEVMYEGTVPPQRFGGEMRRSSNLSQVLEILKTSGVKFTIDGRKVMIKP